MPERNSKHQMLVTFDLAAQQYAMAANYVERITPMTALHCPAGVPKMLRGFLDLAGEPVPVLCLHTLLHLPLSALRLWTPVIILRGTQHRMAFPVDKVNRIIKVNDGATLPLPAHHVFNECVEGIVRWENDSIPLLSPERLLLAKEIQITIAFQEMAVRRISELEGVVG